MHQWRREVNIAVSVGRNFFLSECFVSEWSCNFATEYLLNCGNAKSSSIHEVNESARGPSVQVIFPSRGGKLSFH